MYFKNEWYILIGIMNYVNYLQICHIYIAYKKYYDCVALSHFTLQILGYAKLDGINKLCKKTIDCWTDTKTVYVQTCLWVNQSKNMVKEADWMQNVTIGSKGLASLCFNDE